MVIDVIKVDELRENVSIEWDKKKRAQDWFLRNTKKVTNLDGILGSSSLCSEEHTELQLGTQVYKKHFKSLWKGLKNMLGSVVRFGFWIGSCFKGKFVFPCYLWVMKEWSWLFTSTTSYIFSAFHFLFQDILNFHNWNKAKA